MISQTETAMPLHLTVSQESLERFTTLFQSGILIPSHRGESIGVFLSKLPGFTADYISNRVQTIFLDGNAVDDLQTQLISDNSVLAVSAAMPGLAGAIFRRNSMHAALRAQSADSNLQSKNKDSILVTLKLFNMIAVERGIALLERGLSIPCEAVRNFLHDRPSLFKHIYGIVMGREIIYPDMLLASLQCDHSVIKLRITPYE